MIEAIKNMIYLARRFKLATVLNLAGLVVAFAAFYLLMTQIIYQLNYNHGIENCDRLYRMESDNVFNEWEYSNLVCRPFADALQRMDQVESYSFAYIPPASEEYYKFKFVEDGKTAPDTLSYLMYPGNDKVVSTLTSKKLDGDIEWRGNDQEGIIIPASIAREYFGTVKAAGKEMKFPSDDVGFIVRGVYEDFPGNSELSNSIYYNMQGNDSLSFEAGYQCILKFKEVPHDMQAFTRDFKQAIIDHLTEGLKANGLEDQLADGLEQVRMTNFQFTPLKSSYFEHSSFTPGKRGYKALLHILELACLLVILLATINFLNFTLAESPMRIRSMNTRLVLGASRQSLQRGMVTEGIVTALAACVIALVLCRLFERLPLFRQLIDGTLSLESHLPLVLLMLAMAVLVGIVASYYPARFATSFPPAIALKGAFGLTPQGHKLRKVLIGVQLCVSMLMIIYLGVLYKQSWFIFNSDYGFDKDRILMSELPLPETYDYRADNDTLYQAIMQVPGVEDVAFSQSSLGQADGYGAVWTSQNDETFKFSLIYASPNYLSTMGIDIIEGRSFSPDDSLAVVINKAARNRWNWMQLGTKVSTGTGSEEPDSTVIVGLCDNIRYGTTRINNEQPFTIVYKKGFEYLSSLNVRVAEGADKEAAKQQIDELLKAKYGSGAKPIRDFDNLLSDAYMNEFRYINLMVIIASICLIITLGGVFCLTLFEIEYRRKEIGIRKISGAASHEIVWMLCRHYVNYILISFAIAAPLALYFGHRTLEYFKLKTSIDWWLFPLALVLIGAIVLGTVALQSLRAARENPVNSIKSE